MSRYFAAMYISELWYSLWTEKGSIYGKARAMVIFDQIISGQDSRVLMNGQSLDNLLGKVTS